ncbi:transmembrane protein 14C isoform X2 [Fundulus heteroclitus]|uniref:transmembrane protein 14C isoform X2 n=1 Tax=Fundulus heteroclitus TaxID=8078 RepID=UPI00165AD612|nr:transmembrane protein 14C isoform X2 [Fundulus heteroclitus]
MFPCVLLVPLVFNNIPVSHAEAGGFSSNGSAPATNMSVDWIGYGYATLVASGGVVGYVKAGSVPSLAAGLLFGGLAGFGAYQISNDPNNVWVSLATSGALSAIMGKRFYGSRKFMPAGLMAGASLLMVGKLSLALLRKPTGSP